VDFCADDHHDRQEQADLSAAVCAVSAALAAAFLTAWVARDVAHLGPPQRSMPDRVRRTRAALIVRFDLRSRPNLLSAFAFFAATSEPGEL